MTAAELALFLHVSLAIMFLGMGYAIPVVASTASRDNPRETMQTVLMLSRFASLGLLGMVVTGVWLIFAQKLNDNFKEYTWLQTSITLVIVMGAIAGFNMARERKAIKAVDAGNNAEAIRLIMPMKKVTGPLISAIGLIIIFLMTVKPG